MMRDLTQSFILTCVIIQVVSGMSCENESCPAPLECNYPKISVQLPDPYNKCCNVTECICEGSSQRLSSSHDPSIQYNAIVHRYTNCTWVDGNLEIVRIYGDVLDAVKHIRVVTGYVLIATNQVRYIDLSSLRLIRGDELYYEGRTKSQSCGYSQQVTSTGYSLLITVNYAKFGTQGLREIWMPVLTEIMKGSVKVYDNRDLCYLDSIIWEGEILNDDTQKANIILEASCESCSRKCANPDVDKNLHCWGNSNNSELCQQFTRIPCRERCTGRCNANRACCNSYCAAGCIIDDPIKGIQRSCHACKELNNFGTCMQKCPTGAISNDEVPIIDETQIRYQLTWYCVEKCPSTRRVFANSHCVLTCPLNYFEENGICKKCPPEGCSHICPALEAGIGPLRFDDTIHAFNIGNFSKNCTIIEGSLNFRESSFKGDTHCHIPPLQSEEVFRVFENVEEITGYLDIEYWPYKDLCLFKNLKRIRGYNTRYMTYSLLVMSGGKSLRELCLNSLTEIEAGQIFIAINFGLCFADTVNWKLLFSEDSYQRSLLADNASKNMCVPCSDQCEVQNGCWGSESSQCVTCQNYTDYTNSDGKFTPKWIFENDVKVPGHNVTNCVEKCDYSKGVYPTTDGKCFPCDRMCNSTCKGPGPKNCTFSRDDVHITHGCKYFHFNDECVEKCPITHYPNITTSCLPCSEGCIDEGGDGRCSGPENAYSTNGCSMCYKHYDKVSSIIKYQGAQCKVCLEKFRDLPCSLGCIHNTITDTYACYEKSSNYVVWIVAVCVILVLASSILIILYKCRRTIRTMRKHIEDKIVGDSGQPEEFNTPIAPSGTAPNQAQLRIVKENELAIGKTLGSGAFGAVYKAVWSSFHIEGQSINIPVAVKKLKTFSHNNEILDEAYVMASVDSPYLVRLLGICMTEQVMLITQLMPLGSLLDYTRDNKNNIGSRQMLSWCTQIAKGMQYLQEQHLVHRDLAARNVLVKTPNHVKITDFGLAKMLKSDQCVYFAEGGKLPIKWLAIECITERQFSHQSDVWAFGITCWEIFTFGAKPYEGVHAMEVLSLLERGERLNQPSLCTIDVYMILVKCWMVDPRSRPTFLDLVNDFTNMCKDYSRYIVLQNDPGVFSPDPEEEKRFFENLIKEANDIDLDTDLELLVDEPDNVLLNRDIDHVYQNQTPHELVYEGSSSNNVVTLNQNMNVATWTRKDSEENTRYTEDPTLHKNSELMDEDQYLLPTPDQKKPDYLDPHKFKDRDTTSNDDHIEKDIGNVLPTKTYTDSNTLPNFDLNPTFNDSSSIQTNYMNATIKNGYPCGTAADQSNVPDILLDPTDFNVKSRNRINKGTAKLTVFNNEEYMTTDNAAIDSAMNAVECNKSSRFSASAPPISNNYEANKSQLKDSSVGCKDKESISDTIFLENPEYMMLQDSVTVSDETQLLNEFCS